MFFFIGGISPKITVLDDKPVMCPVCGLYQAHYKRMDHYLNLFFIPVLRVRKGEPFLMCDRCERAIEEMGPEYDQAMARYGAACAHCGRKLHPEFAFCPYCGKHVEDSTPDGRPRD